MSAARNRRLAWMASEISKGKSNAMIVVDCMATFPGTSEKVARKDLKDLLARLSEIEFENAAENKARLLEIGFSLLEEARKAMQYGPAVNQFKTLAAISGVLTDKPQETEKPTGSPENAIVRERIAQLMKNKTVRKQAEEAGIDLDSMKDD